MDSKINSKNVFQTKLPLIAASLVFSLLTTAGLVFPKTANAQKPPDANCPAGYDTDGNCYTWRKIPTLEATCATQGAQRPDLCYSYYQMNCQRGFNSACWMVHTANTNWNYYVQLLHANTACLSGYQDYCAWLSSQNIPQ
jgi:hypothetical protein